MASLDIEWKSLSDEIEDDESEPNEIDDAQAV